MLASYRYSEGDDTSDDDYCPYVDESGCAEIARTLIDTIRANFGVDCSDLAHIDSILENDTVSFRCGCKQAAYCRHDDLLLRHCLSPEQWSTFKTLVATLARYENSNIISRREWVALCDSFKHYLGVFWSNLQSLHKIHLGINP
jgi:hypothetical protein